MATLAAQITALEAELVLVKDQMAAISAQGQSGSMDGLAVQRVSYAELRRERTRLEKKLQRLYRGGRGIVIDMSTPGVEEVTGDNTVFTRVQA